MNRIGIAISGGPNPAEIVELVVLAESLGYASAWVAEGHGGDQFAILAACAMRTSRIQTGGGTDPILPSLASPKLPAVIYAPRPEEMGDGPEIFQ
jgi:Luciferase-like monooxygenase